MSISKSEIIKQILTDLHQKLDVLIASAKAAHQAATHAESKAENQYDTRGLEASYLAAGQAKRADELKHLISIYNTLPLKNFSPKDPIALTALVNLDCDGKRQTYFIVPQGGGIEIKVASCPIMVITPASSLGEALLGRNTGDIVEVGTGASIREYEIILVT